MFRNHPLAIKTNRSFSLEAFRKLGADRGPEKRLSHTASLFSLLYATRLRRLNTC